MILQHFDYIFSYADKKISGTLFFVAPNPVQEINMLVFQDRGVGKRRKRIGTCKLTCQGEIEVPFCFEAKPVFEKIFPSFATKLQETNEFIQVESADYELEIICKWANQTELTFQKIILST